MHTRSLQGGSCAETSVNLGCECMWHGGAEGQMYPPREVADLAGAHSELQWKQVRGIWVRFPPLQWAESI